MCTAVFSGGEYPLLGRTLDLERSYGEGIVVTPRAFPWRYRYSESSAEGNAMIGVACLHGGVPLYFDAVNECGLAMAALNFPRSAVYRAGRAGKRNLASYELIPWILSHCTTVGGAEDALSEINVTGDSVSEALPATPLHWIVADRERSVTVEATEEGIRLYENVFGVLTNEPPFPYHAARVAELRQVTDAVPENRLLPGIELPVFSGGLGAVGLPGDWSSPSRFLRAVFLSEKTVRGETPEEEISRLLHVLSAVSQPCGCARTGDGLPIRTVYTAVADLTGGCYYFTTYENRTVRAVSLFGELLDGAEPRFFRVHSPEEIRWEN